MQDTHKDSRLNSAVIR